MKRLLALLTALTIVLSAGWVHGVWTQRWRKSADLSAAVARMSQLPAEIDGWTAESGEEDRESLLAAGAEGWWIRRFTHRRTGANVSVLLLCGPSGRMCMHRPEHCYSGAGFELTIPPERCTFPEGTGLPDASFWTARFRKPELAGAINLRIFWGWLGEGAWQAPESPRWSLTKQSYLYKLYVIREVSDHVGDVEADPAAAFLHAAVPVLSRALGER